MINVKKRLQNLEDRLNETEKKISTYGKTIIFNHKDWLFNSKITKNENEKIIFDTLNEEVLIPYLGDCIKWPGLGVPKIRVNFNGTFVGEGRVQLLVIVKKSEEENSIEQVSLNGFKELSISNFETISLKLLLQGKGELYFSCVDFSPTEIKAFNRLRELTVGCAVDTGVERFLGSHLAIFDFEPLNWKESLDKNNPNIIIMDNFKLAQWLDTLDSQEALIKLLTDISLYCSENGIVNIYVNLKFITQIKIPKVLIDVLFDKVIDVENPSSLYHSDHLNVQSSKLDLNFLNKVRGKLQTDNKYDAVDSFIGEMGFKTTSRGNQVTVFSVISSDADFFKVLSMYRKQSYQTKKLVLLLEIFPGYLDLLNQFNDQEIALYLKDYTEKYYKLEDLADTDYICFFSPNNYYGRNYLEDMFLCAAHSGNLVVGKGSFGKMREKVCYLNEEIQYSSVEKLRVDRALMDTSLFKSKGIEELMALYSSGILASSQFEGKGLFFSTDKFNFVEGLALPQDQCKVDSGKSTKALPQIKQGKKTNLLIAGHDLKFAAKIIESFKGSDKYNVKLDQWKGHTSHDYVQSEELLEWAEIIICEWGLGNVVWYSQRKKKDQELIVRMHAQEKFTDYHIDFELENIDRIVVVSPWMFEEFHRILGIPRSKMVVIPNYLDSKLLDKPKKEGYQFNIGLIGMNPKLKRLDRALEIFELLWEKDKRFKLYLKGKKPSDLKWLMNREDEKIYYEELLDKIDNSRWKDNVIFEGYGNDIDDFLSKIGFVLSTSDHESFHLAAAEGMASGAVPVILNWEGSNHIYPKEFIVDDTRKAAEYIYKLVQSSTHDNTFLKRFVRERYDYSLICNSWNELLEGNI